MNIDPITMAPIHNAIQKDAILLEEDPYGLLLFHEEGNVLMVWHQDPQICLSWIKKHLPQYPKALILSLQDQVAPLLKNQFGFKSLGGCRQFVWLPKDTLPSAAGLDDAGLIPLFFVRPASMGDLDRISSIYHLVEEEGLKSAIAQNRLFVFEDERQNLVGFGGEHAEGSMGFLYVDPAFRHRGIGEWMERYLIGFETSRNLIPYCHVFDDNYASIALQRKMGLLECKQAAEWMWQT